jgi:diadenosine tetraphosphatase ApaH/serine/threonine PP2A family protein phosphatase
VLIAILSDIHANRQAFSACLDQARKGGAERIALLGDYVGYGADPDWTVATAIDLVDQGALAVRGNHDSAVNNMDERMNAEATIAMEWTRGELSVSQRQFLAALPLMLKDEDCLFVHAGANQPEKWPYITDAASAARSIEATSAQITLCGHVHQPMLYSMSATAKMTAFRPTSGVAAPLLPGRRWLAVIGSVGQPRDGNPAASYAMLDTKKREIVFCRASYDVELAASQIRKKGLPSWLADRLLIGR